MLNLISKLWRILPYEVRLRVVRITQKKFTVSVVAIVTNPENEILILDHYIRPGASWALPGGFMESGEHPEKAIVRELKEETRLDLVDVRLVRVQTIRKHLEILFVAKAEGKVRIKESEIRAFGWYSADDLPPELSDTQRMLIQANVGETSR